VDADQIVGDGQHDLGVGKPQEQREQKQPPRDREAGEKGQVRPKGELGFLLVFHAEAPPFKSIISRQNALCCKTVWRRPAAVTVPCSSTRIQSAFCSVWASWATYTTVLPAIRVRMLFQTQSLPDISMAAVASSSSRISDFCKSARATEKRCRCPPDRLAPASPTGVS